MRILQVIDSLDPKFGGPVELVAQATSGLKRVGDEVELVTFRDGDARSTQSVPVVVHAVGPSRGTYAYSQAGARWLHKNMARFDCVVIHGIWQHSALSSARSATRTGTPYFIYPHGALDCALPEIHPLRHMKKVAYWTAFGRAMLAGASGVCFTSEKEASRATAYHGRMRRIVIGTGISKPPPRNQRSIDLLTARFQSLRNSRVLLYMGRLDPVKGIELLLKSFAKIRAGTSARLVIAGEGSDAYKARLQKLASSLGCADFITWTGMLSGDEKWSAFYLADLFVLTSRQDSLSVASVEAMATGTPVMLTDRVGSSDAVAAHRAGVICKYDEASITNALRDWLSGHTEASAARRNAVQCYEQHYGADVATARLRAFLLAAVEDKR